MGFQFNYILCNFFFACIKLFLNTWNELSSSIVLKNLHCHKSVLKNTSVYIHTKFLTAEEISGGVLCFFFLRSTYVEAVNTMVGYK